MESKDVSLFNSREFAQLLYRVSILGGFFLMLVLRLSLSMNSHNAEYLESQSVDQTRAVSHFFSERLTKPSIRMTMFVFLILKSSSQRTSF